MNIEQEIRAQIEKNRGLKLAVGEINNHLSILEGLLRNERADVQKQVDEAYQKGLEDGKAVNDKECEGCKYEGGTAERNPCFSCSNYYQNYWTAKDDKIEVGDEVIYNNTMKCLVVRPETDERYASLIDSNGNHHSAEHSECKKTGKHFDIQKILEEMQS